MKFKLKYVIFLVIIPLTFMGNKLFVRDKSGLKSQIEFIEKQSKLNKIYSDKRLGAFVENGRTHFRLFAPSADNIWLVTFDEPEQTYGEEYDMVKDEDGVWEVSLNGELYGLYYGFRIRHKKIPGIENIICLDPYARAVATYNTYFSPRRAIVMKENDYDWEGDEWIQMDWRGLIIYEMHIR